MKLRDVAIKRSLGRVFLHHLYSTYNIEINEETLNLIENALADSHGVSSAVYKLIEKLESKGLVDNGDFQPIPRRNQSDLVYIEFEPISQCNLRCKHCFVEFPNQKMSEEHFRKILEGAGKLGAVEITINGGEPLLHPDCLSWIQSISDCKMRTILFTNGTLVDNTIAKNLKKSNLAKAIISLDGFEEEHDNLRGKGTFQKTIKGIENLVNEGVSVFTTTMVYPENHSYLEKFLEYCKKDLGAMGTRISPIVPMGRALNHAELQLTKSAFQDIQKFEKTNKNNEKNASKFLPCYAGVDKLYISSKGDVYPCHLFQHRSCEIGNLNERPLEEVYNNIPNHANGSYFYNFNIKMLEECSDCHSLNQCKGGCRARAMVLSGNINAKDELACRKFKI